MLRDSLLQAAIALAGHIRVVATGGISERSGHRDNCEKRGAVVQGRSEGVLRHHDVCSRVDQPRARSACRRFSPAPIRRHSPSSCVPWCGAVKPISCWRTRPTRRAIQGCSHDVHPPAVADAHRRRVNDRLAPRPETALGARDPAGGRRCRCLARSPSRSGHRH